MCNVYLEIPIGYKGFKYSNKNLSEYCLRVLGKSLFEKCNYFLMMTIVRIPRERRIYSDLRFGDIALE